VPDKIEVLTGHALDEKRTMGFHDLEHDEEGPFAWSKKHFHLMPNESFRYLYLKLGTDRECLLHITWADNSELITLIHGWYLYALDLRNEDKKALNFTVEIDRTNADEPRELGVMVRSIEYDNNPQRYCETVNLIENRNNNIKEFHAGKSKLKSLPVKLRIAMEKRCDIANRQPCVYCAWDWTKNLEHGSPDFDSEFVHSLGKYLTHCEEVVDCSHGEPLLNREFGTLIKHLGRNGRRVAITSNGQLLIKKHRDALLGENVELNVSIDSASKEGYLKYRGEGFEKITKNLTALCLEKKEHSNLPELITSFIVMRSNKHEINDYIGLMQQIGVDRIRFRALLKDSIYDDFVSNRADSTFQYRDEILTTEELDCLAGKIEEVTAITGMPVIIEWKAFVENQQTDKNKPLCSEPWQCLYVLNRGIIPCCFGKNSIGTLDGVENSKLENFLDNTWNSGVLLEMREKLAKRQLSDYCKNTPSCPIVKKIHAGI